MHNKALQPTAKSVTCFAKSRKTSAIFVSG
jgi:hypothetical protein